MPLRLAKFGVPLAETAPAGLAAAGIEPVLLPPPPVAARPEPQPELPPAHAHAAPEEPPLQARQQARQAQEPWPEQEPGFVEPEHPTTHESPWFAAQHISPEEYAGTYDPDFGQEEPEPGPEQEPVMVPSGPGRERRLGVPGPRATAPRPAPEPSPQPAPQAAEPVPTDAEFAEFAGVAYEVFRQYANRETGYPTVEELDIHLADGHGVRYPDSAAVLRKLHPQFKRRFEAEAVEDHIA